jgi:hypothetical protein
MRIDPMIVIDLQSPLHHHHHHRLHRHIHRCRRLVDLLHLLGLD